MGTPTELVETFWDPNDMVPRFYDTYAQLCIPEGKPDSWGERKRTSGRRACRVEGCSARLMPKKALLCEEHSKASAVLINGKWKRYCQTCKTLHPTERFKGNSKNCRMAQAKARKRNKRYSSEKEETRRCAVKDSGEASWKVERKAPVPLEVPNGQQQVNSACSNSPFFLVASPPSFPVSKSPPCLPECVEGLRQGMEAWG